MYCACLIHIESQEYETYCKTQDMTSPPTPGWLQMYCWGGVTAVLPKTFQKMHTAHLRLVIHTCTLKTKDLTKQDMVSDHGKKKKRTNKIRGERVTRGTLKQTVVLLY